MAFPTGGPCASGPGVAGGGVPTGRTVPGAVGGMPAPPSAAGTARGPQPARQPQDETYQPMPGAIGSAQREAEKTSGLVRASTVSGMAMSRFLDSEGRKEAVEQVASMSTEAKRIAEGRAVMLDDRGHDLFLVDELEVRRGADGRMRASVERRYRVRELKTFRDKVDKNDKIMRERVERSWYQTSRNAGRRMAGRQATQARTGKEVLRYRAQLAGFAGTRAAIGVGRGLASYGWSRADQSDDAAVRGVAGAHRANQVRKRLARSQGLLRRRLKAKAYMLNHSKLLMRGYTSGNVIARGSAKVVLVVASAALSAVVALFPILMLALLVVLLVVALSQCSLGDTSGLSGNEKLVADYLLGQGFTTEATAAIMGNIQQEHGFDPSMNDDGYGTQSLGIFQYTGDEITEFTDWCGRNGKSTLSVDSQMEWTFSGEDGTQAGYYAGRWLTGLATSLYYDRERGWQERFATGFCRSGDELKQCVELDVATYSWMACYERPGSWYSYKDDVSRLNKRLEYAQDYYDKLTSPSGDGVTGSGWGEAYANASPDGKRIADAARGVGSPGSGLCAMWVSQVYSAAGFGYPSGNANDMYRNYCKSSNKDELKVGMIIAVPSWTGTSAGRVYGHVGIYIGDGKVMHNVGSIEVMPLDKWISTYGDTYTPRWGWAK